jgi:hypothetical protein
VNATCGVTGKLIAWNLRERLRPSLRTAAATPRLPRIGMFPNQLNQRAQSGRHVTAAGII